MTDTVVAEGQVKFRDGKKWKTRWVVLRKPSPVADCLSLLVYKERKKGKEKGSGHKERLNVTLEGICGVEPGPGYDGVSYTLSILCLAHMLVLGFNSRDTLLAWDARIRYSLGEVHRFSVNVEPGTKLESGPASLHLCNNLLVLTRGLPPVVIGHWKLSALRRYGAVTNGFVFEGGTRCGYWAGVFFLSCSEGEQISFLFDCMVRGITPSRAPHGLRPSLPDPNADPASAEERISQEASELEKRLSMLSHCSLASSTASTYSCSTSVAGDDRSSISSSSSSQSDTSYGSRLPFRVEPLARPHLSNETASSSSTVKALASSDDRLYAAVMGGAGIRPSSAQSHPRGLHDSGRQSSLDSGIGIATGSQSSYSGSCSSCTGSLDTASQGGGEEFGSVASLPVPPPPSSPLSILPPSSPPPPPPSPSQSTLTPEQSSAASKSSSCASGRHSEEYQIPSLLRLRYDTPRSLLQTLSLRETSAQGALPELGRVSRNSGDGEGSQGLCSSPTGPRAQRQDMMQLAHCWGSERAPSVDSEGRSTARPPMVPGGLVCEETQCNDGLDNYITPEQWRSARNRCLTQVPNSPASGLSPSADTRDPPLCVREEHDDSVDVGNKLAGLRKSLPSRPPSAPPPLPTTLSMYRPTSASGLFQSPHEAPASVFLDAGLHSDSTINYVNIPISPLPAKTNRELLYTELDLHEAGSAPVSSLHSAVRGNTLQLCRPKEGSIRYAHLDITAMETAHRVGAEHVQGREDRLTQLENRRRGPPH
ncbi:protein Dok-7-like isoform X2 [Seriola lalandi dorsalis]|uniref:protein Dok-7-like isoform X2 n=1 Tax=Seriola lalandi dorsalis TaxID=1841481 RepID=UPI000C6F766B|nr:protein Dok-7-like isoform X2 [Seriola lalandi dorsalis]